jgi:hypothetical protein
MTAESSRSNGTQIRRRKNFPLEKTESPSRNGAGRSSCLSRSMPTSDCPDTCLSLICPGLNHGEQQSSGFLKGLPLSVLPLSQD